MLLKFSRKKIKLNNYVSIVSERILTRHLPPTLSPLPAVINTMITTAITILIKLYPAVIIYGDYGVIDGSGLLKKEFISTNIHQRSFL